MKDLILFTAVVVIFVIGVLLVMGAFARFGVQELIIDLRSKKDREAKPYERDDNRGDKPTT
jgi:hypothetical protein